MQDQVNATPTPQRRVPWNKGKVTGAKPPLRPNCRHAANGTILSGCTLPSLIQAPDTRCSRRQRRLCG